MPVPRRRLGILMRTEPRPRRENEEASGLGPAASAPAPGRSLPSQWPLSRTVMGWVSGPPDPRPQEARGIWQPGPREPSRGGREAVPLPAHPPRPRHRATEWTGLLPNWCLRVPWPVPLSASLRDHRQPGCSGQLLDSHPAWGSGDWILCLWLSFFFKTHKYFYLDRKEQCSDSGARVGFGDGQGCWVGCEGWGGSWRWARAFSLCCAPRPKDFGEELLGWATSKESCAVLWRWPLGPLRGCWCSVELCSLVWSWLNERQVFQERMIRGPGRKFLLLRDESPRLLMLPHPQPPAHTLCGFHLPGSVFLQPRFLEPQSLWWSRRRGGEKGSVGNWEFRMW